MRHAVAVSGLIMMLAAPLARAQTLDTFEQLPLRINAGSTVRIVDNAGAKVTGRVAAFGDDGLTIRTEAGDRRFGAEAVRRVDVSGQSKARGAWIGAGTMLLVGLVGCPKDSASGCPVFAALLWGAPFGTLVGAWIPSMHVAYRAPAGAAARPAAPAPHRGGSLLYDLGMRVDVDNMLTVETVSGASQTGRLIVLDHDELSLCSATVCSPTGGATGDLVVGQVTRVGRDEIRRVTLTTHPVRKATLIGFVAASVACIPGAGNDWVDAIVLCGGMGAGVGALIGRGIQTTSVVYPAPAPRVSITPALVNHQVGLRARYQF